MENEEQEQALCNIKGWFQVGKLLLKFEQWSTEAFYKDLKVPSYGSWIKIRNLLIDQWSYDTFKLIGELCGGYIETSKKTLARMDMMEASLKVKMNKNGFLPAIIQLLSTSAFSMAVQMDPFFDLDLHIGYIAAVMGPFHRFLQHHFHWRRRWSCFARGRSLKIVLQT